MTATFSDTELDRYVAEVATHLGDLPEADRAELLDDLRQHLAEVAAEDDTPLTTRLGPPAAYAAELLASAGLVGGRPRRASLAEQITALHGRVTGHRRYRAVAAFLPELRPGWWVLRAVLAVYAFSVAIVGENHRQWPIPNVGLLFPLLLAVAIPASVAIGRRSWRAGPVIVANVAIVAGFLVAADAMQHRTYYQDVQYGTPTGLYGIDGTPITNIFPFDADGRPMTGVYLYDQAGRRIQVHQQADAQGIRSDLPLDADGVPIGNRFPYDQVDLYAGQEVSSEPRTGQPSVVIQREATPPQAETTTTTSAPPAADPAGAPPS